MRVATLGLALLAPLPAQALDLVMPGAAELALEETTPLDRYALPVGPWAADGLPVELVEGMVTRQVWRVPGSGDLAITRTLRAQIEAAGFTVRLDCEARDCGGFDFRFDTEVLPPPAMQVDLGAFHFLAAEAEGPQAVGILASPGSGEVFVQVITVAPEGASAHVAPGAAPVPAAATGDIGVALEGAGRAVLADLVFPSGSAQLGEGDYASLAALATWLEADPSRRVALVGHTDTQGGLEGNITLSRRRAASVLERLANAHGVPRQQMQAEGAGWLAPVASNLTPEGREANRRVEAVLVDGE